MLPILSITQPIVEANSPPTNISNMSVRQWIPDKHKRIFRVPDQVY